MQRGPNRNIFKRQYGRAASSGYRQGSSMSRQAAFSRNRIPMNLKKYIRTHSGEKKGIDTPLTVTPVISTTNTNGAMFCVNAVGPGTGYFNRVGRKIMNKSLRITGSVAFQLTPNGTTGLLNGNWLRMLVVWDKQSSGASIPAFSTIFGNTDNTGMETSTYSDSLKFDNMGRFRILRDCNITLDPQTAITTGSVNSITYIRKIDEFIPLNNRVTQYSADNNPASVTDISTGALYVIFRAAENSAISTIIVLTDCMARLRFSD